MKKVINGRLEKTGDIYYTTHQKKFVKFDIIQTENVFKCLEFSYEMAFGKGAHRINRSGGIKRRSEGEIFVDAFQGKMAEYGVYQYLSINGLKPDRPDLSVYGLGKWDSYDLKCNGQRIAIKSTKFYGQLLLLETADWDEQGKYIPNVESEDSMYDFIVLLRIKPSCEEILKKERLLFSKKIDKEILYKLLNSKQWLYDIPGFILNKDLKRLISKNYVLPKGACLNSDRTIMDAENFYVQTGDMRQSREMIKRLRSYAENEMLKDCGAPHTMV